MESNTPVDLHSALCYTQLVLAGKIEESTINNTTDKRNLEACLHIYNEAAEAALKDAENLNNDVEKLINILKRLIAAAK